MNIGVLALQGDFFKHIEKLKALGIDPIAVRKPNELMKCRGLIIPGGESTTLIKLLKNIDLYDALSEFNREHVIFGTCAGAILVSTKVANRNVDSLGLIDIDVTRNAYGRQIDSFVDNVTVQIGEKQHDVEAVFIRAPKITRVGEGVKVIGRHKSDVVMVESDAVIAATFHPELTDCLLIHQHFIDKIRKS